MAGEPVITVVGNLTAPPELRFTPAGVAVAKFTVASTPRTLDKDTNTWSDGETLWLNCSLWREPAENAVGSFEKGTRVIVVGRLKQRTYEVKETGEKRTVIEMDVDELGASVKNATVKVSRMNRSSATGASAATADEWTTPAPAKATKAAPAKVAEFADEPPF